MFLLLIVRPDPKLGIEKVIETCINISSKLFQRSPKDPDKHPRIGAHEN
jgi:hypothetical protein